MVVPEMYMHVLIPGTDECDLIWKVSLQMQLS